MEFKHTLEILYNQTEEIASIAHKIQSGQEIRKIEIDLLLEKLRNVYDLASDVRVTLHFREDTVPGSAEDIEEEPVAEEEIIYESIPEEDPEPAAEEIAEEPAPPAGSGEDVEQEDPVKKVYEEPKPVQEKPAHSGTKRILNEEISEQTHREDVASHYKLTPIASITSAMGINERFELINELFRGDRARFDQTMEYLNSADTFVDAYNYLEQNFDWNMENTYVQRLLELIRRKLIVRRNEQ